MKRLLWLFLFAVFFIISGKAQSSPTIKADFIQSYFFEYWRNAEWENYFDYLQEAGYEYLIIQSTANIDTQGNKTSCFDTGISGVEHNYPWYDNIGNCLFHAKNAGIKVIFGLVSHAKWTDFEVDNISDTEFEDAIQLSIQVSDAIMNKYKPIYGETLYGWYWSNNIFNSKDLTKVERRSTMAAKINTMRDYLYQSDPSMPLIFSPYFLFDVDENLNLSTLDEFKSFWTDIYSTVNFKPGDIVAPEDGIVSAGFDLDGKVTNWLKGMHEAAQTNPAVDFWVNIDLYTPFYTSATLDRMLAQLENAKPYASNFFTFTYTHYYAPQVRASKMHESFVFYKTNNALPVFLKPKPITNLSVVRNDNNYTLIWTPTQTSEEVFGYRVYCNGVLVGDMQYNSNNICGNSYSGTIEDDVTFVNLEVEAYTYTGITSERESVYLYTPDGIDLIIPSTEVCLNDKNDYRLHIADQVDLSKVGKITLDFGDNSSESIITINNPITGDNDYAYTYTQKGDYTICAKFYDTSGIEIESLSISKDITAKFCQTYIRVNPNIRSSFRYFPVLKADFIQCWLAEWWSEADWRSQFKMLKEAGFEYLVLQTTVSTRLDNGQVITESFFPTDISGVTHRGPHDMLGNCLKYAEEAGIKIFVGLNDHYKWGGWGTNHISEADLISEMELGNKIVDYVMKTYKKRYGNTLYGWYWSNEIANVDDITSISGQATLVKALNTTLDHLEAETPSMPLLISPYLSYIGGVSTLDVYKNALTNILSQVNFRNGDIFAPQDGIVGSGFDIDGKMKNWIKAMSEVVAAKEGLKFWVNAEIYDETYDYTTMSGTLDRVLEQLNMAKRYTFDFVTFSYSHYYNPRLRSPQLHRSYVYYRNTGKRPYYPVPKPVNNLTGSKNGTQFTISWTPAQGPEDVVGYRIYRDGVLLKVYMYTKGVGDSNYSCPTTYTGNFVRVGAAKIEVEVFNAMNTCTRSAIELFYP